MKCQANSPLGEDTCNSYDSQKISIHNASIGKWAMCVLKRSSRAENQKGNKHMEDAPHG